MGGGGYCDLLKDTTVCQWTWNMRPLILSLTGYPLQKVLVCAPLFPKRLFDGITFLNIKLIDHCLKNVLVWLDMDFLVIFPIHMLVLTFSMFLSRLFGQETISMAILLPLTQNQHFVS